MKARCPKNPDHKKFITTAHVCQDWVVDPEGNFLEEAPSNQNEVTHRPCRENIWTCWDCGEQAIVE
jgi:hypothetical protein